MEVNGQVQSPESLPTGTTPPSPTEEQAGWTSELVWMFSPKEYSRISAENQTTVPRYHAQISYIIYSVSIKSFPNYKHLLQENYVEYKHIFFYHYLS